MKDNNYDINDNLSSLSKEDRLFCLQLKLKEAMDNKNDAEVFHYSRLLNMYEKTMDWDDPLTELLIHKK